MGLNEILQIGDRIKKYRKKMGITQKEMVKELGIPYSTYSNYENNNRTPDMDTLLTIVQKLGITIDDLLVNNRVDDVYFEFVDIFLAWADDRGMMCSMPFDDESIIKNDGLQNIIVTKDNNKICFTPNEIKSFKKFLYEYFDIKFNLKLKEQN